MAYKMSGSILVPTSGLNEEQNLATPPARIKRLTDRRVLTDRVYDILREAILSSELKPGTALIERDLAERFGVSKSPVRDALQRLAGEGLVSQSSYRGMTVISLGPKEADEIFELRQVLEPLAVQKATPVMTNEDFSAAHIALDRAAKAIGEGNVRLAIAASRQFHDIFIARCNNQLLEETISHLHDRVYLLSEVGWRGHAAHEQDAHRAVLEAAEIRDAELAGRMMSLHIQMAWQYVRDSYKSAEKGTRADR